VGWTLEMRPLDAAKTAVFDCAFRDSAIVMVGSSLPKGLPSDYYRLLRVPAPILFPANPQFDVEHARQPRTNHAAAQAGYFDLLAKIYDRIEHNPSFRGRRPCTGLVPFPSICGAYGHYRGGPAPRTGEVRTSPASRTTDYRLEVLGWPPKSRE
jgi:hypothetical protein